MLAEGQNFGECSIIDPNFIGFEEHLVIGHFSFSLLSFVTINRQTSYDYELSMEKYDFLGILRQNYGITEFYWPLSVGKSRMTPVSFVKTMGSYVKSTESYEVCRYGHHLDSTFTGTARNGPNYPIGPE